MTLHDHLLVYVNGYFLGEAWDDSFDNGFFGAAIYSNVEDDDFTVDIEEVSYWVNPKP
jgi:hypothetical protein